MFDDCICRLPKFLSVSFFSRRGRVCKPAPLPMDGGEGIKGLGIISYKQKAVGCGKIRWGS